jgi:hypothetical protein
MHPMSEEQRRVLDFIRSGKNVIVDACAGSGKSTTILSIAKELTGKKIRQFTYNSQLRFDVKENIRKMKLENLEVHTYHSFAVKYYSDVAHSDTGIRQILREKMTPRKPIPPVDIVVLDESQDMTLLYFELIVKMAKDMCCENPLVKTKHYFQLLVLGDYMQGLYEFKGADIRFLTQAHIIWKSNPYTETKLFRHCELKTSYRITNQMASFVNNDMLGENRLIACREGTPVVYVRRPKSQIENIVVYQIKRLLDEGECPSDIFVLGHSVKGTNSHIRHMENVLTDANIPCYVPMIESDAMDDRVINGKVVFSTFHTVKGRQRKYVFIVGFDQGYFFNARNLDTTVCPNTLYVGGTRATHGLYLLQNENSKPLDFLKRDQYDMKHCEYIDFKGMPQSIFYEPVQESDITIPTYYVNPTELIKFINEDTIEFITPLLEELFVQEIEPLPEQEFNIPKIIETENGLYEEISDLNGIALPALYYDEIQGHKKDGENVLRQMINNSVQETKYNKYTYLKEMIETLPETCETPGDYLFLANLYVASQEKLYSKLKQIQRHEYNWISDEIKNKTMERLNHHLGHEFQENNETEVEKQLIHYSMEKEHEKIDKILEPYFHKEKNFRFSGRLDVLSKTSLWELKCTSKISQEHQLQVIIYAWLWNVLNPDSPRNIHILNIRTGEKQTLKQIQPKITQIVVSLLLNKYDNYKTLTNNEFVEKCEHIIKKYVK